MRTLTERGAESFLEKEGFDITKTIFINKESQIEDALKSFNSTVVLKVSSKKIVHKTKVNGVKKNIDSLGKALKAFRELKKIKNFEGALMQKQIYGKEYIIGLKKTNDFGHVIGFGEGGSKVEEKKNVDFRICGVEGVNELSNDKRVQKVMDKLCKLSMKYPKLSALDINPLILRDKALIADAQVFFE